MNEIQKEQVYTKLTVRNGSFKDVDEKVRFRKQHVLGYLAKGSTKKAAAEMAGITEQTFYNWCKEDKEFKGRADACLGGEDEIIAMYNVSKGVRNGDSDYTKFLLNKRKTYEKRFDKEYMTPKGLELEKNPSTGIFEIRSDANDIASSLLGDGFEFDENSGLDPMEQILMEQDNQADEVIKNMLNEAEE